MSREVSVTVVVRLCIAAWIIFNNFISGLEFRSVFGFCTSLKPANEVARR